jgi:hypothetical protein
MSWKTLRPQIATLLETLDTFQEVSNAPKIKFNGYPAAHIVPSDNESDYETTTENVRTYAFMVRVFYETKTTDIPDAYEALEDIVDDVLDLFDQEDQKGVSTRTVGMSLPSRYTYLNIWAVPAGWGEVPGEELIMAQLSVRVRISVDIQP